MSTKMPPLPTFLPCPGEQLQKLFPLAHDSLASVLGLALAYVQTMHPTKQAKSDPAVAASAHILSLFINDPLIKSMAPPSSHTNTPSKELTALQGKFSSLENTVLALAKATLAHSKDTKPPPPPPAQTAQPKPQQSKGPATPHTYAAKAASPQCPSIVVGTAAYSWPDNQRPSPSDICATINSTLKTSHAQTQLSATKWTQKGNLVIWDGPNTTAHHLTAALPTISEALQSSLSALSDSAPSTPPPVRPNVKWSKLTLNNIPTGKTTTQGAHTPEDCHQTLLTENPSYASLIITQKPSWVRDPSSGKVASSSLTFSFEDPNGTVAQALLHTRQLYAFGHVGLIKRWKQKPPPPKRAPATPPGPPRATTPTAAPAAPYTLTSTPHQEHLRLAAERIQARKGKTPKKGQDTA
ncbi:hypothetical protein F5888DRAFT_1907381 [Russula emetica]|nr:hypothetical protein F5888DRAFT_1907381 [Russula emetica]